MLKVNYSWQKKYNSEHEMISNAYSAESTGLKIINLAKI